MTVPISRPRTAAAALLPLIGLLLGVWIVVKAGGTDLFGVELPDPLAQVLGVLFILAGFAATAQLVWQVAAPNPGVAVLDDEVIVRCGLGPTKRIKKSDIGSVSIDRGWPEVLTVKAKNGSDVSIHLFLLKTSEHVNAESLAKALVA